MLDRLILFSLAAHGLQAIILLLDTRNWRDGSECGMRARWRGLLARLGDRNEWWRAIWPCRRRAA
jgi:hypothetical protein